MFHFIFDILSRIPEGVWIFLFSLLMFKIAWELWVHYIRQAFISGIDWVLLEIIPPREVLRSPKAMELFFTNALYHKSGKGLLEAYWQGAVWFWFSLEIVSLEGQIHFYIRVPTRLKQFIETQLYAQYPQAQVKIAPDYTFSVDKITPESEWNLWSCEFALDKPDAYPIKTYIDFGLDKDPKEEYKIDPLSPVVELFASIGKNEQMWLQIVVTPSRKKYRTPGTWFGTHEWVDQAQIELEKVLEDYTKSNTIEGTTTQKVRPPFTMEPVAKGITDKMLKIGFDCGIRTCYVAKKNSWNDNRRKDLRLIFRQYAKPLVNSFERINSTQFDYPWEYTNKSLLKLKNRVLNKYRNRSFFYVPLREYVNMPFPLSTFFPKYFKHKISVLNVEELATIWHFPGQILKVPTLERIESKEASPPSNLPM